jgi:hypothetical protein
VPAGELERPRRRLDVGEPDHASLDLGDGLLRDDEDVAVLERGGRREQLDEIVALGQLGQALDGDDL